MAMEMWVTHSLDKVFPDSRKPVRCAEEIGQALAKISFTLSDLTGPKGAKLAKKHLSAWWVWYTYVLHNPPHNADPASYLRKAPAFFPDGFLEEKSMPLRDEWTQPLWVSVKVPKGTPPGEYHGVVTVDCETKTGEKERLQVPLTLTVWAFTLPDEFHLHHTE